MADTVEKTKHVTVEALKAHTNAGESYEVGDTYDVDEAGVDNLVHQGMAARVDRVAVAKKAAADAEKSAKARGKTAVEPMTMDTTAPKRGLGTLATRAGATKRTVGKHRK